MDAFVLCPASLADVPLPLFVDSVVFRVGLSQDDLSLHSLSPCSCPVIPVSDGPSLWMVRGEGAVSLSSLMHRGQPGETFSSRRGGGKTIESDAYVCVRTRNAITGKLGGL